MQAKELMTPDPVCCLPTDAVTEAAQTMKRENVGSLPVVESRENKRLVGMVTDRDLVVNVLADGRDVRQATVRDAMSTSPVCCTEQDDLSKVVDAMARRQVRRMPIVDDRQQLRGIIAQADVATRGEKDARTGELVEAISEPSH
jgi:CBS domain-containing protein